VANQQYFSEEVHSPLVIDQDNTFALTMSTSNAAKAPAPTVPVSNRNGARTGGSNLITVEPPKQSDLQVPFSLSV
jgi:hypothetical protein